MTNFSPIGVLRRARDERGFTLVEILVVIMIIAVLAAIAIPSFTSQRGKASDASAKSDARTAQQAEETFFGDHNDYTATAADLQSAEPTLNSANALTASGTATTFTVSAKSRGGFGVVYTIARLVRLRDAHLRTRRQGLLLGLGHLVEHSSLRGSVPRGG